MSLLLDKKFTRAVGAEKEILCKICLFDCPQTLMVKLDDCGCTFCKEVRHAVGVCRVFIFPLQCLRQYITFEVMEGAYDISCPDPNCPSQVGNEEHFSNRFSIGKMQGILNQNQMEILTDVHLMEKYRTFRLNTGKSDRQTGIVYFHRNFILFTAKSHFLIFLFDKNVTFWMQQELSKSHEMLLISAECKYLYSPCRSFPGRKPYVVPQRWV